MKVTFVTSESFIDHSYTIIEELRKHLDLKVFIYAKNNTDEIKNWCNLCSAEFIALARLRSLTRLKSELDLLKRVLAEKSDLHWFNAFSVAQALLAKKRFKNLLVSIHDVEHHTGENDYHALLSHKITYKKYRESVCVMSHTQAKIFERMNGFYPDVMQLPIINYYEKTSTLPKETKKQDGKIRFLFFGSILAYKGIEVLLDAAHILSEQTDKFEINIHGKLKYNISELTKKISSLKNVNHFDKFIDYKDVYNVYSQNDVTVIPYNQVSQSGPLLLSFNQNMPVIVNDLPGFREYVDDNKSGLIYNNTASDLAAKMKMFIDNPIMIRTMSSCISSATKEKFSMASLANNYFEVFKKHVV